MADTAATSSASETVLKRDFNVMVFCQEAEKFVDDKLSNWYVRRNRERFWRKRSEDGSMDADKLAAYQTLYTVLTTLTKLFAPIIPFLTEAMYQNLVVRGRAINAQRLLLDRATWQERRPLRARVSGLAPCLPWFGVAAAPEAAAAAPATPGQPVG